MGDRAFGLLEQSATTFLGLCVLLGAAFVFYRSKRAALWTALGGASLMLGTMFEILLLFVPPRAMPATMLGSLGLVSQLTFTAAHVAFFGGLALALRELARSPS